MISMGPTPGFPKAEITEKFKGGFCTLGAKREADRREKYCIFCLTAYKVQFTSYRLTS